MAIQWLSIAKPIEVSSGLRFSECCISFVQCNDDTSGEKKGWIDPVSHCRVTKQFSLLWLRNCGVFHFEEGKKFSVSAPTLHKICKLKVTFRKGLNHSFEKRFQIMVRYLFFKCAPNE